MMVGDDAIIKARYDWRFGDGGAPQASRDERGDDDDDDGVTHKKHQHNAKQQRAWRHDEARSGAPNLLCLAVARQTTRISIYSGSSEEGKRRGRRKETTRSTHNATATTRGSIIVSQLQLLLAS